MFVIVSKVLTTTGPPDVGPEIISKTQPPDISSILRTDDDPDNTTGTFTANVLGTNDLR